jgi:hypothetical protein
MTDTLAALSRREAQVRAVLTLERCIYQFRIAPVTGSMAALKAALPENRRLYWAGKAADY